MEEVISSQPNIVDLGESLYTQVKAIIGKKQVNAMNLMFVVTTAMKAVEKINTSGLQKQRYVEDVIERLVNEIEDGETRTLIQNTVSMLLPSLITSLCSAAKGQLKINSKNSTQCCKIS